MKTFAFLAVLLCGGTVVAQIERKDEGAMHDGSGRPSVKWFRKSTHILTQTHETSEGVSLCEIYLPATKGVALVVIFRNGKFVSVFNGPALKGYDFGIYDFTNDDIPDFIQITTPGDRAVGNRVVEAYSIVRGIVEPIPESLLGSNRQAFYFDPEIVSYLTDKIRAETQQKGVVREPSSK